MIDLLPLRSRFSSLNQCHHLISNSLGAMPNRAKDMARQYADDWSSRGIRAWEEKWWALAGTVGDRIGALMQAAPGSISIHPNVTNAQAVVLSCFGFDQSRNKVVMVESDFPSVHYIYREWLRERGRLEVVPCPDGITIPTEQLLGAIDDTTALVPVSHVMFRSAYITEVEAIVNKAHKVGARVVLDVYQSLGTVPVNLPEMKVDFAVGGCIKWLCGGPGTCFLYVRPDLHNTLEPRLTGWIAHEDPFAFDPGPIRRTDGAYRFNNGTPSIPALYTCQPGIDIIAEVGVDTIRQRSLEMTNLLMNMAEARKWRVNTPKDEARRGGTVSLDLPGGQAIAAELNARNFLVDYRPNAGIRISPHFYNTNTEIEETVAEIEAIMAEQSKPKQHAGERKPA